MAEQGSREPASDTSATRNVGRIKGETPDLVPGMPTTITRALRKELGEKGLKGFKRGGKVRRTGPAKLHKGERVLAAKAKKPATRKPAARRR
jgi:hypothetical protein